ncbi:O-antigen ligase family protein [Patescibacteria group bacterium]|nr:O-antigen ligase family protein [Patescibacteria group bacterium]MDL1952884.1 O-antigen ligase family protein [Candidatus Uhrbacteria bacterium UHB]RIL01118.1 MAG: hypothetical protein DCC77_01080 [Candidatus Uhrbacteria bacterium]
MNRDTALKIFKFLTYVGIYGGLLMPVMFLPVVIFPFVFSKLVFLQVLIGLTFPAYVALAWMDPAYRPPKSMLYWAIIAYFVALSLSTAFSVDPIRSWWGNQERMNGLFTLLHLFAWLTMTIGVLKSWKQWYRLLNYQVALSVFMAVIALLQKPFPRLLQFQAGDRVGGLLDNPIYMGAYQIFSLAFIALLFLKTKDKLARFWFIVAACIDLAAFFAAQSRGALIGLAAFVAVFALYYAVFTKQKKVKLAVLGGAGAFFGLYVVAFLFRATAFVQSIPFLPRLLNLQAATETRFIAWRIAWEGFLERPLTGWGFDAFHILFNLKYNPRSLEFGYYETWFDRAHNTVMDVISMTGLFGIVTFAAIFLTLFILVWKAWRRGWIDLPIAAILTALPVGYFLQNLFVFDHPAAFSMSYLMFALTIAATQPAFIGEKEESEAAKAAAAKPKTRTAPWVLFAALQIAMLFVVWRYSVLPFKASTLSIRGNQLLSVGRIDEGWQLLKQAGTIPTPYVDEQTFLLSRDMIDLARSGALANYPKWPEMFDHVKRISEAHLKDHPRNTHPLFIYARFLQEMIPLLPEEERMQTAILSEQMYKRAIDTSPKRQQLYFGLARLYSSAGQKDQAYDTLKTALDFNRDVGESWWYVGLTDWFDRGNEDAGSQAILNAVDAKSPYQLQVVNDAFLLAQAAALHNDVETLKAVLAALPKLGGGSVQLYLQIARVMERAGLIEERNIILNAILQIDPSIGPQLEGLRTGLASSIDESIQMAGAFIPTTTPDIVPPSDAVPEENNTTTASAGGSGPRR